VEQVGGDSTEVRIRLGRSKPHRYKAPATNMHV
jgi:hypothetical protein